MIKYFKNKVFYLVVWSLEWCESLLSRGVYGGGGGKWLNALPVEDCGIESGTGYGGAVPSMK